MVQGGVVMVQNGTRRGSDGAKWCKEGATMVQNGARRGGDGAEWGKEGQ